MESIGFYSNCYVSIKLPISTASQTIFSSTFQYSPKIGAIHAIGTQRTSSAGSEMINIFVKPQY